MNRASPVSPTGRFHKRCDSRYTDDLESGCTDSHGDHSAAGLGVGASSDSRAVSSDLGANLATDLFGGR